MSQLSALIDQARINVSALARKDVLHGTSRPILFYVSFLNVTQNIRPSISYVGRKTTTWLSTIRLRWAGIVYGNRTRQVLTNLSVRMYSYWLLNKVGSDQMFFILLLGLLRFDKIWQAMIYDIKHLKKARLLDENYYFSIKPFHILRRFPLRTPPGDVNHLSLLRISFAQILSRPPYRPTSIRCLSACDVVKRSVKITPEVKGKWKPRATFLDVLPFQTHPLILILSSLQRSATTNNNSLIQEIKRKDRYSLSTWNNICCCYNHFVK